QQRERAPRFLVVQRLRWTWHRRSAKSEATDEQGNNRDNRARQKIIIAVNERHLVASRRHFQGLESVIRPPKRHSVAVHARIPIVIIRLRNGDQRGSGSVDFECEFLGGELAGGDLRSDAVCGGDLRLGLRGQKDGRTRVEVRPEHIGQGGCAVGEDRSLPGCNQRQGRAAVRPIETIALSQRRVNASNAQKILQAIHVASLSIVTKKERKHLIILL